MHCELYYRYTGPGNLAENPIFDDKFAAVTEVTGLTEIGTYEFKLIVYNYRDLLSDEDHVRVFVHEG